VHLADFHPVAMMSRPVAGIRHKSVIVTLPGSPKGAKENLQSIIKTLPHACVQVAGADSRALHSGGMKKLEAEAGFSTGSNGSTPSIIQPQHDHGHHHHHHDHAAPVRHSGPGAGLNPLSNDPSLGPSRRHRESPYPMISVQEALGLIREQTPAPVVVSSTVNGALVGSVLAEDVKSPEDVPAFRASIVDGYAVVVPSGKNLAGKYPVVSISHASPQREAKQLREKEISRITTGAPLPPGATSVVMVEDTILSARNADGEELEVEILAENVKEGENIREIGSDVAKGAVVLRKGESISAVGGELGLLASVGIRNVLVYRRPIVGVLSTGDELVEKDESVKLQYGAVRDTNRPTLISAARHWGFNAIDLGIARDKQDTLETTMRDALKMADVVITSGGVSMGELDLLKPTIERALGGTIHFGRVAMKPGKPTTFATVSIKSEAGDRVTKTVFSLPGNPASALVTFHLFVLPSLQQMSGQKSPGLPRVPAVLAHDFQVDRKRPEYHRAIVEVNEQGILSASSTGGQRSSKVGSLRGANALLALPSGDIPLKQGTKVNALLLSNLVALD
jgi:gephyrin